MIIRDLSERHGSTTSCKILRYDTAAEEAANKEIVILHENLLSVYINDVLSMKMVSTASDLAALVVGHLYTEGRIHSADDINLVYVCPEGVRARVLTNVPLEQVKKPLEIRACDCGEDGMLGRNSLFEDLEAQNAQRPAVDAAVGTGRGASEGGGQHPRRGGEAGTGRGASEGGQGKQCPVPMPAGGPALSGGASVWPGGAFVLPEGASVLPDFNWRMEDVKTLIRTFHEKTPVYRRTNGIHSSFLFYQGEVRFFCEDIGRHNALDKVIGRALIEGFDLTQCMIYSSGRIPDDMIEKIIRARVPVLVSSGVPTDKAVELARLYHVNLICSAHEDAMNIVSSKEFWE